MKQRNGRTGGLITRSILLLQIHGIAGYGDTTAKMATADPSDVATAFMATIVTTSCLTVIAIMFVAFRPAYLNRRDATRKRKAPEPSDDLPETDPLHPNYDPHEYI